MTVEEELREYRSTLDAATEGAAASQSNREAPPVRIPPARTLVVAAVAVAAAAAVAFAATGASHKRSTPPAGNETSTTTPTSAATVIVPDVLGLKALTAANVTLPNVGLQVHTIEPTDCSGPPDVVSEQSPIAGTRVAVGSQVSLHVCGGGLGVTTSVPVVACRTEKPPGDPLPLNPSKNPPSTVTVKAPTFADPLISAYSGSQGWLITTAPAGWECLASDTPSERTAQLDMQPADAPSSCCSGYKPEQAVDALSISDCARCVWNELCAVMPSVNADFPEFPSRECRPYTPATITPKGDNVIEVEIPAGVAAVNIARLVFKYTPATPTAGPKLLRGMCVLPPAQRAVCDTLLEQFLALN